MKLFILALVVMSTVSIAQFIQDEMDKFEKGNAAIYMMVQSLTLLEDKPECFTSLKGVTSTTTPLAVRVYYDFMRVSYFENLIKYDEDKKKPINVFSAIMKDIGVGVSNAKAINGCNKDELFKRAKEKLKDYCKLDFKIIKNTVVNELKAEKKLDKECKEKITEMFKKIEGEYESMTTFTKKYLDEMVPMLKHQFLTLARNFFSNDFNKRNKFKFIMIYEMMKFEQARSSRDSKFLIKDGEITVDLKKFITMITKQATEDLPNVGLVNLNDDFNTLVSATSNPGTITPELDKEFTTFIRNLIPNLIVLI